MGVVWCVCVCVCVWCGVVCVCVNICEAFSASISKSITDRAACTAFTCTLRLAIYGTYRYTHRATYSLCSQDYLYTFLSMVEGRRMWSLEQIQVSGKQAFSQVFVQLGLRKRQGFLRIGLLIKVWNTDCGRKHAL